MRRNASLIVGAAVSGALVALAVLSLVWTPWPTSGIDIAHRLAPPGGPHFLGTDALGRDVLSLLMAGARTSLLVALVAAGVGAGVGVPLGLCAAAAGGWADALLMRATDLTFAFPALLTAVMITALAGPGAVNAMLAIGIFNVSVFLRVTRGAAAPLWHREFVLAARAAGRGKLAISLRHILPGIAGVLIVQITIQFALGIGAEAGLAYVGLGAQPPRPSWGRMLNDAQTYLFRAPWLALFPGAAITLAVLGFNLLGDGLRDALDPRLRRRRG